MTREMKSLLLLAETMAVEASLASSKRLRGHCDVVVAGQHKARFEYEPTGDTLHVDTMQGHFEI